MDIIKSSAPNFEKKLLRLISREGEFSEAEQAEIKRIVSDVAREGDEALLAYARELDGADFGEDGLQVGPQEIERARSLIGAKEMKALRIAAANIERFHRRGLRKSFCFITPNGAKLGSKVRPIESVGIYVPGGKAVYPSTLLMAAIPARIAGVKMIIVCTPVRGVEINPYILAAAEIAGVDKIYKVGGPHAIAAMAYGTRRVPRVDKIVGPGGPHVVLAKKIVFGQVDIDMIAGPSELVVLADASAEARIVAADLLTQAEHSGKEMICLITDAEGLALAVQDEIARQKKGLSKAVEVESSIAKSGLIIICECMMEGLTIANRIAPEHLLINTRNPDKWLKYVKNAGAVFLGAYTPPTLGDYCAGPNHILPTGGTARFFSALCADDFLKRINFAHYTSDALEKEGAWASLLARIEGFDAHARAVEARMKSSGKGKGYAASLKVKRNLT